MAQKTPIWLDCDPGHDDTFAIILAAEHPNFELLGISTVHGNASRDHVTANAISVLTAIGKTSIPVYAGARKPFMRVAVHAPAIHGESGLDGTSLLPEPKVAVQPGNPTLAMYNTIMETPLQSAVIVATGALTNVALLFATFPEVVGHIKALSIMGGAFGEREDSKGNIKKTAEFNIFCDPESAQSIFSNPELSGRITLIPLDLTHTVRASPSVLSRLLYPAGTEESPPTNFRKMLYELLTFFADTYAHMFGNTEGPPLHDPIAVAAVLPDSRIHWDVEQVQVEVICHGEELGRTVKVREEQGARETHLGNSREQPKTLVRIPKSLDVDAFWGVLLETVKSADGRYTWG